MFVTDSLDFRNFPRPDRAVVTMGSFDGIHLGHRRILYAVRRLARKVHGQSCVVTFYPHPRRQIYENQNIQNLTSLIEKTKILAKLGMDYVIILPFNASLAQLSAEQFFQSILLDGLNPAHIVMGYDHAFGHGRKGDFAFLQQKALRYGFGLSKVEAREIGGKPVSSSRIRYLLGQGDLLWANRLLGRRYGLRGTVVSGEGRGRKMGIPTANLQLDDPEKMLPPDGVYEGILFFPDKSKSLRCVVNIGRNPTFMNSERTIEVHILNFNENIYSQCVELFFVKYIRRELRFFSVSELIQQIRKDIEQAAKNESTYTNPIQDSVLAGSSFDFSQLNTELYFARFEAFCRTEFFFSKQ